MAERAGLASDATLETVVSTLMKPEDHVRVILKNMQPCYKEHGNAVVRIGVTGEGKVPYHRISYVDADSSEHLFGAFDGLHRFDPKLQGGTWSAATMSFDAVRQLLGRIRGYQQKR